MLMDVPPAQPHEGETDNDAEALALLQEILFQSDRERLEELARQVASLQQKVEDKDALAAAVAPVLGEAIRRQIQDSRAEIIDALYPIIGQIVMKAVTEAIRDLVRAIDERVHTALDFQTLWRRLKSWLTGVPEGELALREALPFRVQEIFLIHRESGLLLWHGSRDETGERDPDLVSGMLTAIRDFAQEVMGGQEKDALDELHFGPQLVVMEFGRYSYVAAVCWGTPPVHFRSDLRRRLYAFDSDAHGTLRHFDGNAQTLAQPASSHFRPLLEEE